MRIVDDFSLPTEGDLTLSLSANARPLWVGMKGSQPTISFLHEPGAETIENTLRVIRSGVAFDEKSFSSDYIGSFSADGLVSHVVILRNV